MITRIELFYYNAITVHKLHAVNLAIITPVLVKCSDRADLFDVSKFNCLFTMAVIITLFLENWRWTSISQRDLD